MTRTMFTCRGSRPGSQRGAVVGVGPWAALSAAVFVSGSIGCGGGGGPGSGAPEGYGVTSNVGTLEEDELQNESANQDPFVQNPNPIPD
ncbi:MAG: hypothetical protein ACO3YY_12770 [Phycisphaerales bacterium]